MGTSTIVKSNDSTVDDKLISNIPYFDVEPVIRRFYSKGIIVFYICGGRGVGKSYSAYKCCHKIGNGSLILDPEEPQNRFLYLRRTAVEMEAAASPTGNAFKKYNRNTGQNIVCDFVAKLGFGKWYNDISNSTNSEATETSTVDDSTKCIGYSAALSTFSNLRGIDYSDVQFVFLDECIPENKSRSKIKNEGTLLLNVLETINRNRELEGKPPCILLMCSNPIDLGNEMLSQLAITPILSKMILRNQQRITIPERALHIEKLKDHKVSEAKRNTALYKFAQGTSFIEESLSGDFVNADMSIIANPPLEEYRAFITVEDTFTVYQHKSEELYYITSTPVPAKYNIRIFEREKLRNILYFQYKYMVVENLVTYNNFNTKVIFESLINYKPL